MLRDTQAGFTLLETLVALAVLAVSASFLLSATESHARNTAALSDRMIALWVAQNRVTQIEAGLSQQPGSITMAGASWRIRTAVTGTSDADLLRLTVGVAPEGKPGATLATLTTFIDAKRRP